MFKYPYTDYRGQTRLGKGELEKLQKNEGSLISMNTFLSTTTASHCGYYLFYWCKRSNTNTF